ncbi:MAG: HD domain-containing protein [Lachnospiraceae bacterium]|nr:HD domain-containing protein [Lachnospiraceae bacterium]
MMKAIFSGIDITGNDPVAKEYMECVKDIFCDSSFKNLKDFTHHRYTCRLMHSVNVSYYSFLLCRKLGWNKHAAARAGLMHDLYHYDSRGKSHFRLHPGYARDNALKICRLDPVEEDAILKHMWPVTKHRPIYREAYVVCITDKLCATAEYLYGRFARIGIL